MSGAEKRLPSQFAKLSWTRLHKTEDITFSTFKNYQGSSTLHQPQADDRKTIRFAKMLEELISYHAKECKGRNLLTVHLSAT